MLQPKIDSRGECFSKALQHLLTGVYLAELCLIGLFGAREAPGPTALMIILLIVTALYHSLLNRILSSLNAHFGVNKDGETVLLLAAEETGGAEADEPTQTARTKAAEVGLTWLPTAISEPIAVTLESFVSATYDTVKGWLNDPSTRHDGDEEVTYSQEEMEKAYKNPILTSNTPKLWLVKDQAGVSKEEIAKNEAAGIPASDDGAYWGEGGELVWEKEELAKLPVWKKVVLY